MSPRERWFFGAGAFVAFVALFSPMEEAAAELFSMHMVQHLVLLMVVPPLLVAGWPKVLRVPSFATAPILVGLLQAGVIWAWHLPVLYDAAIETDVLHMLEHASFLAAGCLFWGVVMGRFRLLDPLTRVGLIFVTALQSAALGALLALASAPLYESHLESTKPWGLTPLEDQQLAGGIMWVPPGVIYLAVMLFLLLRWFRSMDADAVGDR